MLNYQKQGLQPAGWGLSELMLVLLSSADRRMGPDGWLRPDGPSVDDEQPAASFVNFVGDSDQS
jgi:hypothetical protein